MAKRLAFIIDYENNQIVEKEYEFKYYAGYAVSQKHKNIRSLHNEIQKEYPKEEVLEVSTKSLLEIGQKLSAFNLKVMYKNKELSVENIFQASKVFEFGGPYVELLELKPIEAKKNPLLHNSGELIGFSFDGKDYPREPKTAFYDFLYCRILKRNIEFVPEVSEYKIFTDIEFVHEKSYNCQARALAKFILLYNNGVLEENLKNIYSFIDYFGENKLIKKEHN